jgi:hypothetical protein
MVSFAILSKSRLSPVITTDSASWYPAIMNAGFFHSDLWNYYEIGHDGSMPQAYSF